MPRDFAMSAPRRTLGELLSPIDCDHFFRDHWERQPLQVLHDDPQRYENVLTSRDVDKVIAFTRPRFADSSAFLSTASPPATYVRGALAGQFAALPFDPGLADLRDAYDRGKSVVIMSMQHRWPAVATLCRGLEAELHCPVHANLYITPAGSQGFAAHYDPHEVFALQLDGVKHWRLYDHVEPFPTADTVRMPESSLGKPLEVCLRPGDLLYIPRGHVHDAYTKSHSSLHLTVGINVYRWADLLHNALASATRNDVRLRESIPGGALPGDRASLKARFRNLLASLAEGQDLDRLFDLALNSLGTQFFDELKMLPGSQFAQPDAVPLAADTVLERSPLTICRVVENEHGAAIEFPGNRVTGPCRIASALRFVAAASRFMVRDLPDDLNLNSKLTLVGRLVHEGLLTVVKTPNGTATTPTAFDNSQTGETAAGGEAAVRDEEGPESAPRGPQPVVAASD